MMAGTTRLIMDALVIKEEEAKVMNPVQKVYIDTNYQITKWQKPPWGIARHLVSGKHCFFFLVNSCGKFDIHMQRLYAILCEG